MKKLASLKEDLTPSEYMKMTLDYGKLKEEADCIKEKHYLSKEEEAKILSVKKQHVKDLLFRSFEKVFDPNEQNASEYLYVAECETHKVHVFSLKEKKLGTYQIQPPIPSGIATCCVDNELFAGGGTENSEYFSAFFKVNHVGSLVELSDM